MSLKDEIMGTSRQFVNALNYTSAFALYNREFTRSSLPKLIYRDLRKRFGLRSQMAINCIREVDVRYKSKFNTNRERDRPVFFKQRYYALNYPCDYRIVNSDTISINTLAGRVKAKYVCGKYQRELLDSVEW